MSTQSRTSLRSIWLISSDTSASQRFTRLRSHKPRGALRASEPTGEIPSIARVLPVGSTTEAVIEAYAETDDGKQIDAKEHFRKTHDAQPYQTLVKLRAKISDILQKRGITVLPAEEWRKPVPGLRGGEDTIPGIESKEVRVLDAFFFEEF